MSPPRIDKLLAAALVELDARTAPNAAERPTPVIKAAVEALMALDPEPEAGSGG